MSSQYPTIPPPPRVPNTDGHIHARGSWGSVAIPTAVICAVITAVTNWITRPTATAEARPADTELHADVRELRSDVKQILSRLGALEDAVHNDSVIRAAKPHRDGGGTDGGSSKTIP